MYICTPRVAEREEEGQWRPLSPCVLQEGPGLAAPRHVGSAPALTALILPPSQTQLRAVEGEK